MKGKNNRISSYKCSCEKDQSCKSFYSNGKNVSFVQTFWTSCSQGCCNWVVQIPAGCPTPTCNVDYEITDAWGKHGAHNTVSKNQPQKFGYAFKIKVPAVHWTRKGFSILIRWREIESASFQLWNANFFNIYRKKGGIDVLIHSRPYNAYWDRVDAHEFVFVADRLAINSLRKFFSIYQKLMKKLPNLN